ncbi:MAG: RNA polymerase sigma factor [Acidimicrobiia bacterium]
MGTELPGDPADLAELVTRARSGDRRAFDELVRSTYVDTYTLAMRLTANEEDARDVVQETYLRAWKGIDRFRGDARFSTWLYRITANVAYTHIERRRRHRHDQLDELTEATAGLSAGGADAGFESSELADRLAAAVMALPTTLRTVLVLKDVYGLPHEAIAEDLAITETAAKVRLHRARKALRDAVLEEREGAVDAV